MTDESLRASALDEARELICGDRNNAYGPPHQDFQRSADALTAIMGEKLREGERFHAHEIAQIVILIKLSRLQWTPTKRDSWVDIAGYAACGFEAAALTSEDEEKRPSEWGPD